MFAPVIALSLTMPGLVGPGLPVHFAVVHPLSACNLPVSFQALIPDSKV